MSTTSDNKSSFIQITHISTTCDRPCMRTQSHTVCQYIGCTSSCAEIRPHILHKHRCIDNWHNTYTSFTFKGGKSLCHLNQVVWSEIMQHAIIFATTCWLYVSSVFDTYFSVWYDRWDLNFLLLSHWSHPGVCVRL